MKTNKHTFEEMEMDMTPMIDVVFLLIIFFMLITDMTQQDLEVLTLPKARTAVPDEPDAKEFRPVINIRQSGEMISKREVVLTPPSDGSKEDLTGLMGLLVNIGQLMKKDYFTPGDTSTKKIPDEFLLIRADRFTDFHFIQTVMTACANEAVQIWKIQLAAGSENENEEK